MLVPAGLIAFCESQCMLLGRRSLWVPPGPLNFSLECPPLSATKLLFFRFCSHFTSSHSISVCLRVLHCWSYFRWLSASAVVYSKNDSLIDLGWVPFLLVSTNQAWTMHRISPCGSCFCCSLHSVLIGRWRQWCINDAYVDPTQKAMGSLTSPATSLWSCWQPRLSQQVSTEQSVLMATTDFVLSTFTLTFRLTDLFSP